MPLLRDQSPSARIYPFVRPLSPRQKPTRTFFNRLRYQCCSQQDPCAVVCSTPLTEITMGVITWDELEQALGSQSRASSGRKHHQHEFRPNTHTQTHTNMHLQRTFSTHRHTRTRSFDTQTHEHAPSKDRLEDAPPGHNVITDTQHARDITTHAQHNTYPPIALLPQPFSRIPKPSNMSQKHGARFWVLSVCSPC